MDSDSLESAYRFGFEDAGTAAYEGKVLTLEWHECESGVNGSEDHDLDLSELPSRYPDVYKLWLKELPVRL